MMQVHFDIQKQTQHYLLFGKCHSCRPLEPLSFTFGILLEHMRLVLSNSFLQMYCWLSRSLKMICSDFNCVIFRPSCRTIGTFITSSSVAKILRIHFQFTYSPTSTTPIGPATKAY